MNQTIDSPLDAVTCEDPYPYYASLVCERPFYFDPLLDLWVASSAAAVDEVLGSRSLGVRPPDEPVPANLADSRAGDIFRHLIRMTDGPFHQATKPAIESALNAIDPQLARGSAREVAELILDGLDLARLPEAVDRFMFQFPVSVVARLAGVTDADLELTARSTGIFVDALKPGSSQIARDLGYAAGGYLLGRRGTAPAGEPSELLEDLTGKLERDVALANALGLLMQSYEATAGLIGNTLVALRRLAGDDDSMEDVDERFVREVARFDSPVQNTRRFAASACRIAGRQIRSGEAILVILAAANRDPVVNPDPHRFHPERRQPRLYTFGHDAHACPGAGLAIRIAVEGIAALTRSEVEFDLLPKPVGYVDSLNARIPRFSA